MEKLSAAQVGVLLKNAAAQLRSQASEIVALKSKVAAFERREHAEKIAQVAVERGIMEEDEADLYAGELASNGEDLDMVEKFIGRAAAGAPLGRAHEKVASATGGEGGTDVLTAFLLGNDI